MRVTMVALTVLAVFGFGLLMMFKDQERTDGSEAASSAGDFKRGDFKRVAVPVFSSDAAIEVSANKLVADYEANEVSADDKYKGRLVRVTGIVENIGIDIMDNPYVQLKSRGLLQCTLENDSGLASLRKGEKVVVVGRVSGKLLGVSLVGCRLVR